MLLGATRGAIVLYKAERLLNVLAKVGLSLMIRV